MPNPKDTKENCRLESFLNAPLSHHYPGCHKVHIECANKAIEEIRQILIKQDAENQMDDWMHKLHPVYSWLERWKSET